MRTSAVVAPAPGQQPAGSSAPASWFDGGSLGLERRRVLAAAAVAATCAGLAAHGHDATLLWWAAALLAVETVLMLLPWRLPRRDRSGWGFWAESLAGLVAPLGILVVALASGASWLWRLPHPGWWGVGAVAGLVLVLLSGLDPRRIVSGELAFAAGPTRRSHGRARAFAMAASPAGEEVLFRSCVLVTGAGAALPLLAAVGFVARHHVAAGTNRRDSTRSAVVEVVGAAALTGLVVASGSLLPALVAHVLNNLPNVVVELQRDRA